MPGFTSIEDKNHDLKDLTQDEFKEAILSNDIAKIKECNWHSEFINMITPDLINVISDGEHLDVVRYIWAKPEFRSYPACLNLLFPLYKNDPIIGKYITRVLAHELYLQSDFPLLHVLLALYEKEPTVQKYITQILEEKDYFIPEYFEIIIEHWKHIDTCKSSCDTCAGEKKILKHMINKCPAMHDKGNYLKFDVNEDHPIESFLPFDSALVEYNHYMVRLFLEKGVDPNKDCGQGPTPMEIMASGLDTSHPTSYYAILKTLISYGADFNSMLREGKSFLQLFFASISDIKHISEEIMEIVELMATKGINFYSLDEFSVRNNLDESFSPVEKMARNCDLFLTHIEKLNSSLKEKRVENIEAIKQMLTLSDAKYFINARDRNMNTPLHLLLSPYQNNKINRDSEVIIEMLVEKGANIFLKNNSGESAYDISLSIEPSNFAIKELPLLTTSFEKSVQLSLGKVYKLITKMLTGYYDLENIKPLNVPSVRIGEERGAKQILFELVVGSNLKQYLRDLLSMLASYTEYPDSLFRHPQYVNNLHDTIEATVPVNESNHTQYIPFPYKLPKDKIETLLTAIKNYHHAQIKYIFKSDVEITAPTSDIKGKTKCEAVSEAMPESILSGRSKTVYEFSLSEQKPKLQRVRSTSPEEKHKEPPAAYYNDEIMGSSDDKLVNM